MNNTLENHQSDILIPGIGDIPDLVSFFVNQIQQLTSRVLITREEQKDYIDWHTTESMKEKIADQTRFFRLIRDADGKIIAYFESKQHSDYADTQVVQWILVDEGYRNTGLSKILRREFYTWCTDHGYKSTWTYVHQNNQESQRAHANLGEYMTQVGDKTLFILSLK